MPLKRYVNAFEDEVQVVATMDVGKLWDRMVGEFLGEWERLQRQQLSDDELDRALRAFLDGLSDKPVEDLARQSSTVAYNQGRSAEILSDRTTGGVRYVVRSEVLDTNTCRPCGLLDSEVFEVGTSEYYANMPPAQCDGGDRCRGFFIPVSEQMAAEARA